MGRRELLYAAVERACRRARGRALAALASLGRAPLDRAARPRPAHRRGLFRGARSGPRGGAGDDRRATSLIARLASLALALIAATAVSAQSADRPRARDLGIEVGILPPGPLNAITDVAGVEVGHVTLIEGDSVRTGVTAIVPPGGNIFQDKLPAGFAVGNGFGKFAGSTQIMELGEIETPILLTNTLSVPEAMAGTIEWTLAQPGNEEVRSVNAVVGETNDGFLNDIRARRVRPEHAIAAIEAAAGGPVAEGSIGAGTGTIAFGWKGGIGTASRRLPADWGGHTVGVLVQTNYGGVLAVDGIPIGEALGQHMFRDELADASGDGSVIIVIATDAPLSDRNLTRLARRAFLGIGRTGSPMTNGSGDYAIAFSTAEGVRRTPERRATPSPIEDMPNDRMTPLFQAVVEATEEAVLNSMFASETMTGHQGRIEGLPVARVMEIWRPAQPRP
ncbi:MAG: P1 family peptidase [Sphingomonadaceae bacterium]|nr:P1 family peptidase [Sphingomonadaceae bacterium]